MAAPSGARGSQEQASGSYGGAPQPDRPREVPRRAPPPHAAPSRFDEGLWPPREGAGFTAPPET
eukprot:15578792-Heterocapsa_arctica.AAC.1